MTRDPESQHRLYFEGGDPEGVRCPVGAHVRRVHPRDAFGFDGRLINRRRITRRGLPYGDAVAEGAVASDADERGVIFMALNANISRQFEFIQQQWIEYGNDAHVGNDKDMLMKSCGPRQDRCAGGHERGESAVRL